MSDLPFQIPPVIMNAIQGRSHTAYKSMDQKGHKLPLKLSKRPAAQPNSGLPFAIPEVIVNRIKSVGEVISANF